MLKRFTSLILLCCLWLTIPAWGYPASTDLQAKRHDLDKALKAIEQSIDRAQHQLTKEEKKMADMDLAIHTSLTKIHGIEEEAKETASHITALEKDIEMKEQAKEAQIHSLESMLRTIQKQGSHPLIKSLLSHESLQEGMKQTHMLQALTKAQSAQFDLLLHQLKTLAQAKEQLESKKNQLVAIKVDLQAQQKQLHEKKELQQKLIYDYQASIKHHFDEKSKIIKEQKNLSQLLLELEKKEQSAFHDLPSNFKNAAGKLPLPLSLSRQSMTWSNDYFIQAPEGSAVRAIYPGKVVFAQWMRGLGLLLILDHGDGYMSLYGNNEVLYKSTGEWVKAGETIASVGKSGGLAKAGLYFEIRKNGRSLPTKQWLAKS